MDTARQPIASTESSPTTEEQTRSSSPSNQRNSIEWDASKVPPSRFQKRKGSIYAVPSSRDGHVDSNYNTKFHEKHAELWKDGVTTPTAGSAARRESNAGSTTSNSRRESNAGLFGGRRGSNAN